MSRRRHLGIRRGTSWDDVREFYRTRISDKTLSDMKAKVSKYLEEKGHEDAYAIR